MSPKKILIITHDLRLNSGWGRYSYEIVSRLKQDLELSILTEDDKLMPPVSFFSLIKNILITRKSAKEAEIVHAFDGWPYSLYGYGAVLGTNKRLFINGVGTYSVKPISKKISGFILRRAYLRAERIFAISRYTASKIKEILPNSKVVVNHLGLSELPESSDQEKKFNLKRGSLNVLTVGAIKPRKGQDETLEAIRILKSRYPDIQYWIVGEGYDDEYNSRIKSFIDKNDLSQNVRIFNNVNGDSELSFFYKNCDVFVLNSKNVDGHFEGFGLVILEAAQFGKPAVGSRDSGIEDAIIDGETGYLVESENISEIADAIDKAQYLSSLAVVDFAHSFNWQETVECIKKVYLEEAFE